MNVPTGFRKYRPFLLLFTGLIIIALLFLSAGRVATYAAVSTWQRGVAIMPVSDEDFSSATFRKSLANAQSLGFNYVSLVIPLYQADTSAATMSGGFNTPSENALGSAVDAAHALKMGVNLFVRLDVQSGEWQADIDPSDRKTWFGNYQAQLLKYAKIGQKHQAEEMTLGSELVKMTSSTWNPSNTENWNGMIGTIRRVFPGKLTYSARMSGNAGRSDEMNAIGFWNSLDYLGVAPYYNLSGSTIPDLQKSWAGYDRDYITPWQAKNNKPVLFTDIGYRSVTGAHARPWDAALSGPSNQAEQAYDYAALFGYWSTRPFMAGITIRGWDSDPYAGGAGETGYSPQNKLAQVVIGNAFLGNAAGAPAAPVPRRYPRYAYEPPGLVTITPPPDIVMGIGGAAPTPGETAANPTPTPAEVPGSVTPTLPFTIVSPTPNGTPTPSVSPVISSTPSPVPTAVSPFPTVTGRIRPTLPAYTPPPRATRVPVPTITRPTATP